MARRRRRSSSSKRSERYELLQRLITIQDFLDSVGIPCYKLSDDVDRLRNHYSIDPAVVVEWECKFAKQFPNAHLEEWA